MSLLAIWIPAFIVFTLLAFIVGGYWIALAIIAWGGVIAIYCDYHTGRKSNKAV